MESKKQYADRDHQAQGGHYITHVGAMTAEGLHRKSAVAAELAHRDIEIARLHAKNTALQAELLEMRNLKIRPPLSDLGLAGLGVKFFGNPIPQGWYQAARALEAAHGILWSER